MSKLFGLIGYPLSHSLSRDYFLNKFEKEAVADTDYRLFPMASLNDLPPLLEQYSDLSGFNVTTPYKQSIIPYLHELSNEAERIGSVNVVSVRRRAGKPFLKGYNTDYIGFKRSLDEFGSLSVCKSVILGTGGAAQAVACALKDLGISFCFVSRKPSPLACTISYSQLTADVLSASRLIVNATPVGMSGVGGELDFPYHLLCSQHILYDLIYAPAETDFLYKGRLRGCVTKNGLEMLYLQADASWHIWNNSLTF